MLLEVVIPKPDRARVQRFAPHRWREHHAYHRDLLRLVVMASGEIPDPQPVATVGPVNDGRGSLTVYDIPGPVFDRVRTAVEAWAAERFKSDAEVRAQAAAVGSVVLGVSEVGFGVASAAPGGWGALFGGIASVLGLIGRAAAREEGPTVEDARGIAAEIGAIAVGMGEPEAIAETVRERMLARLTVSDPIG